MDLTPGAKSRNVTRDFDCDVASGVGGDNTAPRAGGGNSPVWSADGRSICEVYAKEGKTSLGAFEVATGKETDVLSGNQAVVGFRAVPDASQFVCLVSTPTRVGDLFLVDRSGGNKRQLTHLNDELFSHLN